MDDITIEQKEVVVLPMGRYGAQVREITKEAGQFGDQLKWKFDLVGDHVGKSLVGWCSCAFTPKSKLYRWAAAVLGGREIPKGVPFQASQVIGKYVFLDVLVREGDNGEYNKVDELRAWAPPMPANGQTVKTPPAPTVQASVPVVRATEDFSPPPLTDAQYELLAQSADSGGGPF